MGKGFTGDAKFSSTFEIQSTNPIDDRLVLESTADLDNYDIIEYPYIGLVVNIKGTDELYVLTEWDPLSTPEKRVWKKIKGAESIDADIKKLTDDLATLESKHTTDLVKAKTDWEAYAEKVRQDILGTDDNLDETIDTIKEIANWIENHEELYEDLKSATKTNLEKAVSDLTSLIESTKEEIDGDISDLNTALETTKTNLNQAISDLNTELTGKITALENKVSGEVDTKLDELEGKLTTAKTELEGKITALETKHGTDKTELEGKITNSMLYQSAATDTWETVQAGGIAAKTKPSAFVGKTVSEMLDEILYPTLQPIVPSGKPSVGISGGSSPVKVGSTIPAKTAFTGSVDRGNYTYKTPAGDTITGGYYAGEATTTEGAPTTAGNGITINRGSFGGTFEEGSYVVTYSATFAAGPTPVTNKGGAATGVTGYAGGPKSTSKTINAVYPLYANTANIETCVEVGLKDYIANNQTYEVSIPAEDTLNKFTLKVPAHLTVSNIVKYSTQSGKWDIDINYMLANKTTETIGSVQYNVYVRSTDPQQTSGDSRYQITVNKKA